RRSRESSIWFGAKREREREFLVEPGAGTLFYAFFAPTTKSFFAGSMSPPYPNTPKPNISISSPFHVHSLSLSVSQKKKEKEVHMTIFISCLPLCLKFKMNRVFLDICRMSLALSPAIFFFFVQKQTVEIVRLEKIFIYFFTRAYLYRL
ncbi:MAG: hypothetical protein O7C59_05405, partial [Rickettsia endosymbiont of Ixodes persulcatus]|nr:hypothetical protein [Rickettsia endosymbiont of Ixodes persulcatus]